MENKKNKKILVLDLDDTLYLEKDYFLSGVDSVSKEIKRLYNKNIKRILLAAKRNNKDIWREACITLDLPISCKENFIWMYRLHEPKIKLNNNIFKFLREKQKNLRKILILTDGRSITQRKKIINLGLENLQSYISEEYNSKKPALLRFKLIMERYKNCEYIYVGDNSSKDFLAPNKLGWLTIGIKNNKNMTHQTNKKNIKKNYLPRYWISDISQLKI